MRDAKSYVGHEKVGWRRPKVDFWYREHGLLVSLPPLLVVTFLAMNLTFWGGLLLFVKIQSIGE